jgi:hypothetical protein
VKNNKCTFDIFKCGLKIKCNLDSFYLKQKNI